MCSQTSVLVTKSIDSESKQVAQASRAGLSDPELQQMFHAAAFEPRPDSGPEHVRRFLNDEIARWSPIIKSINLKLD